MLSNCLLNNYVHSHRLGLSSTALARGIFGLVLQWAAVGAETHKPVKVLRISDCGVLRSKWNAYIDTRRKHHGKTRQEECTSRGMGRRSVAFCLPDTRWLLRSRAHSRWGHLYKTRAVSKSSVGGGGAGEVSPLSKGLLQLVDGRWELGSKFSLRVWLPVGHRHLSFHEIPNVV